jgi:hypothetical protein
LVKGVIPIPIRRELPVRKRYDSPNVNGAEGSASTRGSSPVGGRTKLFNYEWRELADVCLTDIARAHPDIYELCERIDVMRWGHAMISPRPNFIWSGVREKAIQPYGNLHFAHTDLSGIALFEEAFYHGLRAAGEITAIWR